MKKLFALVFFAFLTTTLAWEVIFKGWMAIPGDILIGHYYPWRDYVWDGRNSGYPLKNFALADVISQLYPWKKFAFDSFKNGQISLWNPYNFTGVPQFGNIATSALYPLNLLFLFFSFKNGWNFYIVIQPLLAAMFMYLYLQNKKLSFLSSTFGGMVFAFSSFLMMRFEYGIVGHTWLWLPLVLLSVDKVKEKLFFKFIFGWWLVGVLAITMMFLGGYIQALIYGYIIIFAYIIFEQVSFKSFNLLGVKNLNNILPAVVLWFSFFATPLLLSAAQFFPFIETISNSDRAAGYGQKGVQAVQYLISTRRLIGLIAPDFFGNPTTANFWANVSYTELALYAGMVPLFFGLLYILHLKKRCMANLWVLILAGAFIFLIKSPFTYWLYSLNIPVFSALLPSRLTSVIDLCLAILSAYGFDLLLNNNKNKRLSRWEVLAPAILISLVLISLIWLSLFPEKFISSQEVVEKLKTTSLRNLILPSGYLLAIFTGIFVILVSKNKWVHYMVLILFISLTSADLLRQARKYNTFIKQNLVFPEIKLFEYLRDYQIVPPRLLVTHTELMPPNTNLVYKISMIDGYDSVHNDRIGKLLNALNGMEVDSSDESLGRATFTNNYKSDSLNLLSPEYIFTLDEKLTAPNFELINNVGRTSLYKNSKSYPRVYLTKDYEIITDNDQILQFVLDFSKKGNFKVALEDNIELSDVVLNENSTAKIVNYKANSVEIEVQTNTDSLLVFNDAYDEGWQADIDSKPVKIYRANYAFRGVIVTSGKHRIVFTYQPISFKIGLLVSSIACIFLIGLTLYLIFFKNPKLSNKRL